MRPNYYGVQRKEWKKASYETNAAKNKEINILSVKKDEHLKVEVLYIVNTLWNGSAYTHIEWEKLNEKARAREQEKKLQGQSNIRCDAKRSQKVYGLKRMNAKGKGARKWKGNMKKFFFSSFSSS